MRRTMQRASVHKLYMSSQLSHLFFSQWFNSLVGGGMDGSLGVLQHAYHYCNMPHVGSAGFATYPLPPVNMDLLYVEVVQRHHKRTPYASNTFPHEDISWSCDDVKLVSYGIPDGTEVASVHVSYQRRLARANWDSFVRPVEELPGAVKPVQ